MIIFNSQQPFPMKNFRILVLSLLTCFAFDAAAQTEVPLDDPNINRNSPNTETAFLNYDFKFQSSGFERVDGGPINLQPGSRGKLHFKFDPDYDYTFVAVADSTTGGVSIQGKPVTYDGNVISTDDDHVMTEWGSRILVFPMPNTMIGDVVIEPTLMGTAVPKESSYFLLLRKRKSY